MASKVVGRGCGERTCGPYQEGALVAPALKVCHEAVNDVRLRGEEVDGIGVGLRLAAVLDALDVCGVLALGPRGRASEVGGGRTGDVGVEDVILLDDIVDEAAAVVVGDQDLPLRGVSNARADTEAAGRGLRRRGSCCGWC